MFVCLKGAIHARTSPDTLGPNAHRLRDATRAQIGTFFLWCCLHAVWTPPFTSTGPICSHRVARGVPRPVWIGPKFSCLLSDTAKQTITRNERYCLFLAFSPPLRTSHNSLSGTRLVLEQAILQQVRRNKTPRGFGWSKNPGNTHPKIKSVSNVSQGVCFQMQKKFA